jgi:hypothetical protein
LRFDNLERRSALPIFPPFLLGITMKGKSFFVYTLIAIWSVTALLSTFTPASTFTRAASPISRPVIIDRSELEPSLSSQVFSASGPVVIEFYDSTDPDTSGECAKQIASFHNAQKQFTGKVTMLRADVQSQDANMIARERIAVCPTHVFVLEKDRHRLIGKRLFGYLSEKQFEELVEEFYNIKP